MKNNGYSIFKSNGTWFVRWSEYRDGKRMQPSHKLCTIKQYPKESEVKPLADTYMATVRKTMTVEAGASVKEFVNGVFLPKSRERLSKNTVHLYENAWQCLEPSLGHLRLRDVRVCDVQNALDRIHAERCKAIGHHSYLHYKVTCSAIFSHTHFALAITQDRILRTAPAFAVMGTGITARMQPTRWRKLKRS